MVKIINKLKIQQNSYHCLDTIGNGFFFIILILPTCFFPLTSTWFVLFSNAFLGAQRFKRKST